MQSNFHLISQIFRGPWLLDASTVDSYRPHLLALLEGREANFGIGEKAEESTSTKPFAMQIDAASKVSSYSAYDQAPQGSVAIIPVQGVLMRSDNCGAPGTDTLRGRLAAANAHPNIKGTILLVNSGGGAVDGTEEFANDITNSEKPVVTFVPAGATMGSAAYWIGSAAKHIIIGGKTSSSGCIGIEYSARQPSAEERIIKVRSTPSVDKNEAHNQLLLGNFEPIRAQILDPLNNAFMQTVQENRAGKLSKKENVLSGKVYVGAQNVEYGLADAMGTLSDAVLKVEELAASNPTPTKKTTPSKMKMTFMAAHVAALALLSINAEAAETTEVTPDHIDKLSAGLQTAADSLTAEQKAHQATAKALEDLQAEMTTVTASRDEWQQKAEKYGAESKPTVAPVKEADEKHEVVADKTAAQIMASLPHNQNVLNNPLFTYKAKS